MLSHQNSQNSISLLPPATETVPTRVNSNGSHGTASSNLNMLNQSLRFKESNLTNTGSGGGAVATGGNTSVGSSAGISPEKNYSLQSSNQMMNSGLHSNFNSLNNIKSTVNNANSIVVS